MLDRLDVLDVGPGMVLYHSHGPDGRGAGKVIAADLQQPMLDGWIIKLSSTGCRNGSQTAFD